MLNFDVKRKINTLRDILVGKVPDPKAQVEQITIALIYKFMDDIDQQGADFGGSREFSRANMRICVHADHAGGTQRPGSPESLRRRHRKDDQQPRSAQAVPGYSA